VCSSDLVAALVNSGWLDEDGKIYLIHDWNQYGTRYKLDGRERQRRRRERVKEELAKTPQIPQTLPPRDRNMTVTLPPRDITLNKTRQDNTIQSSSSSSSPEIEKVVELLNTDNSEEEEVGPEETTEPPEGYTVARPINTPEARAELVNVIRELQDRIGDDRVQTLSSRDWRRIMHLKHAYPPEAWRAALEKLHGGIGHVSRYLEVVLNPALKQQAEAVQFEQQLRALAAAKSINGNGNGKAAVNGSH
jgi:hypothetical protein